MPWSSTTPRGQIPSGHPLKAHLRYVGTFVLIDIDAPMRSYELRDEAMNDTVHAQWHSMMDMVDAGNFSGALAATYAMDLGADPVVDELLNMITVPWDHDAGPWVGVRKQRKK